jgi:hypothetical protein
MKNLFALSLMATLLTPSAFASVNAGTAMQAAFPEIHPDANNHSLLQTVRDEIDLPDLDEADEDALPSSTATATRSGVNYAQPPVGCVEEMVPHRASRECLDLSDVNMPSTDWPEDLSREEKAYWWKERRGLAVCRAEEILRRERKRPGSQSAFNVQMSWMTMEALKNYDVKVKAVYDGARANNIPLQVLTGAIYQESVFAELGVSDDGGNFSCGVQQINIIGWCDYMNKQSAEDKAALNWPQEKVTCTDPNMVHPELIRPLYNVAKARFSGPAYRMKKENYQNIPLDSFVKNWPAADRATNEKRYSLIMSYINNCSDPRRGILAKSNELATIYGIHISAALKAKDRYPEGQKFNRQCREAQVGDAYPLHTGWMMAVASYNGGPRAVHAAAYYEGWSADDMNNPEKVKNYTPTDLIKGLYWGGKYNSKNDQIEFMGMNGVLRAWPFFKACVAQRHVARVMQHVTLTPTFFADTLEGASGCVRGQFDSSGELIKSGTPAFRQRSSGRK